MAARPLSTPRWAETATGTPAANITAPLAGEQDTGWVNGQVVVSSGKMNYLFRLIYDWILYVADAVFVAATGSALPGVTATGDGASPGVKAIPGGGGTPARGALNLAPQAAPTAPVDGDIWTTAAGFFARIAGSTWALAALAVAQTWTSLQTFNAGIALGAQRITGVADPTAAQDAATKNYVDSHGVRAWAVLTVNAGGTVTVAAGSGIASATWSAADLTITLSTAAPSANYVAIGQELNNVQIFMTMGGLPTTTQFTLTAAKGTAAAVFVGGEQVRVAVLAG